MKNDFGQTSADHLPDSLHGVEEEGEGGDEGREDPGHVLPDQSDESIESIDQLEAWIPDHIQHDWHDQKAENSGLFIPKIFLKLLDFNPSPKVLPNFYLSSSKFRFKSRSGPCLSLLSLSLILLFPLPTLWKHCPPMNDRVEIERWCQYTMWIDHFIYSPFNNVEWC